MKKITVARMKIESHMTDPRSTRHAKSGNRPLLSAFMREISRLNANCNVAQSAGRNACGEWGAEIAWEMGWRSPAQARHGMGALDTWVLRIQNLPPNLHVTVRGMLQKPEMVCYFRGAIDDARAGLRCRTDTH